jgi:hypothetical protein
LPLGNGEFCCGVDGTGLQTFSGNIMSHWGWHSFPLPEGWTPGRVPATGTFQKGRNTGGDQFPAGATTIRTWMFDNPHIMNMGRLRLMRPDGHALTSSDLTGLYRTLDLWTGVQTARYQVDGQEVQIETCVHPRLNLVAVRIASPLVASGQLEVALDFAYPALNNATWVGDFAHTTDHTTMATRQGERRIDIVRNVDAVTYHATLDLAQGSETAVTTFAQAIFDMHDEILQHLLVVTEKAVLGSRGHQHTILDRPDRHFAVALPRSLSALDDPAVKVLAVEDIHESILGSIRPGQRNADEKGRCGSENTQGAHEWKSESRHRLVLSGTGRTPKTVGASMGV